MKRKKTPVYKEKDDQALGSMRYPQIFSDYPGLKKCIPWISLGDYPTPVERMNGLGFENLWIKRDDLSSPLYGGNKVRKLEFLLAEAKTKNKSHVVTMGGIGTNHGLATAAFCQRVGLNCSLLLFQQPVTSYVQKNLRLFRHFGAHLDYQGSLFKTALSFYTSARFRYPGAFFIFAGGSTPRGTLGFVNAAFELKKQVEDGELPEPDYIYCPLGSNGTLAGLTLGARLAGLKSKVIGVRVTAPHLGPLPASTPGVVLKLMRETYRIMRKADPALLRLSLKEKPLIIDDFFGDGYGCVTPEGAAALKEVREKTGIELDPCYTAKAFAGVKERCRIEPGSRVLYWHTYSSVDLSDAAESISPADFPISLRGFLSEETDI